MDDYDDYGDSDAFSPVPVAVSIPIDATMPLTKKAAKLVYSKLIETVETQTEGKGCSQESARSKKRRKTKGRPQKAVADYTKDQGCAEQTPKTRQ